MISRKDLLLRSTRRLRRKRHIRNRVFGSAERPRLTVFRSHKNIYCQIVDDFRGVTLASASTRSKDVSSQIQGFSGNCAAAAAVGKAIAERAQAIGIKKIQFDRKGYRFHGRVKALAEAARASGLEF
ncbi:MAG: 50S ribosomal protein L18 [Planctomycetes bacterium]|nr:50S ribosomal protein L18 [Planctomycetota bacterium]